MLLDLVNNSWISLRESEPASAFTAAWIRNNCVKDNTCFILFRLKWILVFSLQAIGVDMLAGPFWKLKVLVFIQLVSGISVLSTAPVMKTYRKYFHYSWTLHAVIEQNFIKQSETFPRIPLPHPYIMVIYFEFKNSDPLCMSRVGAVIFITFVPKSFEFQLCIFKAFINAVTSQFFLHSTDLAAKEEKKNPNKQLNLLFSGAQISPLLPAPPEKQQKWCGYIS